MRIIELPISEYDMCNGGLYLQFYEYLKFYTHKYI